MTAEVSMSGFHSDVVASSSSVNRLNQDLTTIDREDHDLENRIIETRKELEDIKSTLLKYEGIRNDLTTKLFDLETKRRECLLRRSTLLETHNVFGSLNPPLFETNNCLVSIVGDTTAYSKSTFLSKLNGDDPLMEAKNLQDMVSELFSSPGLPSSSATTEPTDSGFSSVNGSNGSNGSGSCFSWSTSSVDKKSNGHHFSNRSVFNSSSSSPFGFRCDSSEDPFSPVKTFSNVSDKRNPSPLSTSGIQSFSEAVGVSLTSNSASNNTQQQTPPAVQVNSCPESGSPSPQALDHEGDLDSSLNDSQSSNQTNGSSGTRFILRQQTNGTQVAVGQNRPLTYNSVLALETSSNGFVYKSLADKSVCRFRFGNTKDTRSYTGHNDKVKVLCLDLLHNLLYTGCDDGKVRCFNINTGTSLCEIQCEGAVIGLEKGWDNCLVVATNKGWIYTVKNQLTSIVCSHRVFNWICTFKPLLTMPDKEFKNKKVLLVLPMKHKPSIIDSVDGKVLRELGDTVIESKPCLQVNGGICIISTTADKNEAAKSVISVFDAGQVSPNFRFNLINVFIRSGIAFRRSRRMVWWQLSRLMEQTCM